MRLVVALSLVLISAGCSVPNGLGKNLSQDKTSLVSDEEWSQRLHEKLSRAR